MSPSANAIDTSAAATAVGGEVDITNKEYGCSFHHVHMYVDSLRELDYYKLVEKKLAELSKRECVSPFSGPKRFLDNDKLMQCLNKGTTSWSEIIQNSSLKEENADDFVSAGKDIVEQLIVGLGWRVTAQYTGTKTRTVMVTSEDPLGVKMVVTAPSNKEDLDLIIENAGKKNEASSAMSKLLFENDNEKFAHFSIKELARFYRANSGRMGIATLAFELSSLEAMAATKHRYQTLHPLLYKSFNKYATDEENNINSVDDSITTCNIGILESFAYYVNNKDDPNARPDSGTCLRFVQRNGSFSTIKKDFSNPHVILPGLSNLEDIHFDGTSISAYSDHWVSNVINRTSFIETLGDVLKFSSKVDFNAGVVAAGRARIESTVSGNNYKIATGAETGRDKAKDELLILRNQSQVYLPINNALTEAGHVHHFIDQMGQGVQHIASRVKDLVSFIERVNNYRKVTGNGLTFLNIPQNYYGCLSASRDLSPFLKDNLPTSAYSNEDQLKEVSQQILDHLACLKICNSYGVVDLDMSAADIENALLKHCLIEKHLSSQDVLDQLVSIIRKARYSNLYSLLKDHFDENTYMQIVRNKILVDIQSNDVLCQIFTCNILQRNSGEEAPFLEFIQRVCSQKKLANGLPAPIRPGCGGFGIRNFLTLFLSIEVSKAMHISQTAENESEKKLNQERVALFTNQLDESNPILTAISDAMTAEADTMVELEEAEMNLANSENQEMSTAALINQNIVELKRNIELYRSQKIQGNSDLESLSDRYLKMMEKLVEDSK